MGRANGGPLTLTISAARRGPRTRRRRSACRDRACRVTTRVMRLARSALRVCSPSQTYLRSAPNHAPATAPARAQLAPTARRAAYLLADPAGAQKGSGSFPGSTIGREGRSVGECFLGYAPVSTIQKLVCVYLLPLPVQGSPGSSAQSSAAHPNQGPVRASGSASTKDSCVFAGRPQG